MYREVGEVITTEVEMGIGVTSDITVVTVSELIDTITEETDTE